MSRSTGGLSRSTGGPSGSASAEVLMTVMLVVVIFLSGCTGRGSVSGSTAGSSTSASAEVLDALAPGDAPAGGNGKDGKPSDPRSVSSGKPSDPRSVSSWTGARHHCHYLLVDVGAADWTAAPMTGPLHPALERVSQRRRQRGLAAVDWCRWHCPLGSWTWSELVSMALPSRQLHMERAIHQRQPGTAASGLRQQDIGAPDWTAAPMTGPLHPALEHLCHTVAVNVTSEHTA